MSSPPPLQFRKYSIRSRTGRGRDDFIAESGGRRAYVVILSKIRNLPILLPHCIIPMQMAETGVLLKRSTSSQLSPPRLQFEIDYFNTEFLNERGSWPFPVLLNNACGRKQIEAEGLSCGNNGQCTKPKGHIS